MRFAVKNSGTLSPGFWYGSDVVPGSASELRESDGLHPTPSSASPFDMVSSALGQYMPVDGAAAAAGSADSQGDNAVHRDVSDDPTPVGQEQILGAVNLDRDLHITRSNLDAPVFAGVEAVAGSPFVDLLPPRTYRRSPGGCGRSSRPVSRTSPGSSACDAATGRSWWSR